jgi:hypothetical protein
MRRRLALALATTTIMMAVFAPTVLASSHSFSTDSWGCDRSGTSGSGLTSATAYSPVSCADDVGVQMTYYTGSTWRVRSWKWAYSSSYVSDSVSGTEVLASHQVYVDGNGYSQVAGKIWPF